MNNQGIKTKKQIISILILIVIMLLTGSIFIKGCTVHDFINAFYHADYVFLLAGLGMMFLFIACEAANIFFIMKVLGQPVSLKKCFIYSFIGFYFSSITPSASGGQPAQVYYMKQDRISLPLSSLTMFYIMFVYQIGMILLGIAAFIFSYKTSILFISRLKYLFLIGAVINTGAILLFFLLMFSSKIMPAILSFFIKAGSRLHLIKNRDHALQKAGKSMHDYHEKALIIKQHPVLFLQVLFITIIQMLALCLIPFFVYKSMGYHSDHLVGLTACQALLTIAVSAIPLPGAEGVTQAGFLQVFGMFFPNKAIAYAMVINRVLSFYLPLFISFIIYIIEHISVTKRSGQAVTD